MTLTTYIIDDEQHAIDIVADYVNRTPGLKLEGFSTDALAAFEILKGANPPALTFLDIDMPGLSGIELAGLAGKKTSVVFITSFREFGAEAYEVEAADYLLKPISYARFLKCVQKVQDGFIAGRSSNLMYVKGDLKGKFISVDISAILYIRSELHYVDIFTDGGEKVTTYLTLHELLGNLPGNFCRVHRSYIINLDKIKAVEQAQLRLENKELIPLGRGYRDTFFKKIAPSIVVYP